VFSLPVYICALPLRQIGNATRDPILCISSLTSDANFLNSTL